MKLLTFATLFGTAAAFLAPAPKMARTQGRVSTCFCFFLLPMHVNENACVAANCLIVRPELRGC